MNSRRFMFAIIRSPRRPLFAVGAFSEYWIGTARVTPA
jgi:hypothetical protein